MSIADMIETEYGGIDSANWSAPALQDGWSLTEGLKSAATTATQLFSAGMGLVSAVDNFQYQREARSLDLLNRSSALDLERTFTGAKIDIAKTQAQTAAEVARYQSQAQVSQARAVAANSDYNLATVMGNINARIAGLGGNNQLMLWLAVAGVGIAALQFFKGRK
jgi:hypothetical protein